jgi:Cu2+-exporting ATPase
MKKTIKIEGMMCVNCENHVKKALGALENVTVESVSHEKDEAVVSLSADVPDDVLKAAVEEEGYKVISIG